MHSMINLRNSKHTLQLSFIVIIAFFTSLSMYSQELQDYKWKNRIILIISSSEKSEIFNKQINALEEDHTALEERKLILFKILPSKFKINLEEWKQDSNLYDAYNPDKEDFKIILIGLDGGIKLNKDSFKSRSELFALIDGMPMRQAELRN